jgi:DNA-binding beta-propeller fold protein YncE
MTSGTDNHALFGQRRAGRPRLRHALALTALTALGLLTGASSAPAVSFESPPKVTSTIALPDRTGVRHLYQAAYDPGTGLLYVADRSDEKILVIYTAHATRESTGGKYTEQDDSTTPPTLKDPPANTIVREIVVDGTPVLGLGLDPTTHKLYGTATTTDKLVIVQGNDGTAAGSAGEIVKTITLPGHTRDVVVNPANHRVYIDQTNDTSIAELDGATGRVLRTFDASGGDPDARSTAGLTANWGDGVLYAINQYEDNADRAQPGQVVVIDIATGDTKQVIGGGGRRTITAAYDARRDRLFVTNQGTQVATPTLDVQLGSVSTFAVGAGGRLTLRKTVATASGALGTAVDVYNGLVYSTNFDNAGDPTNPGTVTVLDADSGDKLTQVTVGSRPLHTVVDPVTHTAYVTNQYDASVTIINASMPARPSSTDASTAAVSPATADAGETVTVTGTGFTAGQPVSVKFDDMGSSPLATTNAQADGTFSLEVTIPASAKGGPRHWLRVLGTAGTPAGAPARSKLVPIRISSPTATVSGTFDVPVRPEEFDGRYWIYQSAYNPKTGLLYVADPGAGRIRVIYTARATRESTGARYVITPSGQAPPKGLDPPPNTVVKSINVAQTGSGTAFNNVLGLGINTKTNELYGSTPSEDGKFYVINLYTDAVKTVLKLGEGVGTREIRVDEANNLVYATVPGEVGSVVEISGATNTLKRTIKVAPDDPAVNYAAGLALNLEHGLMYVANPNFAPTPATPAIEGSIAVIDIASGATVQKVPAGDHTTISVAYDKASSRLFVTNQGRDVFEEVPAGTPRPPGSVSTLSIDPQTGRIASTPPRVEPTAFGALGLALDAPRGVVYSTDYGASEPDAHTVSVLSYETGEKIGSIDVGRKPLHASVDPETGMTYVTNQYDATVSVIAPGKLVAPPAPPAPPPPPPPAPPQNGQKPVMPKPLSISASRKAGTARLKLAAGTVGTVRISVKTRSKVRVVKGGKRRIVTVTKTRTIKHLGRVARTVTLSLSKDGRALLKQRRSVAVVVRISAPDRSAAPVTRTLNLRAS